MNNYESSAKIDDAALNKWTYNFKYNLIKNLASEQIHITIDNDALQECAYYAPYSPVDLYPEVLYRPIIIQNPYEVEVLLNIIKELGLCRGKIVEIGFGFGGTHFLYRNFFSQVVTVTIDPIQVALFEKSTGLDKRSFIVLGDSRTPETIEAVRNITGGEIDVLYIDGNHEYEFVKSDYLNYYPLVKCGGLIAFHDTGGTTQLHAGVSRFIKEMKEGFLSDRMKHHLFHIRSIYGQGTSFEIKRKKEETFLPSLKIIKAFNVSSIHFMNEDYRSVEKELESILRLDILANIPD